MKIRLAIEDLNIRNCIEIHMSYLYTISDPMGQPYGIIDFTKKDGVQRE